MASSLMLSCRIILEALFEHLLTPFNFRKSSVGRSKQLFLLFLILLILFVFYFFVCNF